MLLARQRAEKFGMHEMPLEKSGKTEKK